VRELDYKLARRRVAQLRAGRLARAMTSVFNNLRLAGYGATRRTATRARAPTPFHARFLS
jgi:hypothetical protein